MQELFEAVRESCSRANWSKGVELARSGAVLGEKSARNEVICKVTTPAEKVARTVVLSPEDEDWSCDCRTTDDVCQHVAAAVIAVKRAHEAGEALPQAKATSARVGYRFARQSNGLHFDRVLVQGGKETSLETSLTALMVGPPKTQKAEGPPPHLLATPADLSVEVALGSRRKGWFPKEYLPTLFEALSSVEDVKLDGEPVRISKQPVGGVLFLEDRLGDFLLTLKRDPVIEEVFANGVARCGHLLRTTQEPPLTGREIEELKAGRRYTSENVVELVTEVLPALKAKLPVEIRTKRLPKVVRERPRLHVEVAQDGDALQVLPTVVYGDPPIARVDGGRLKSLGGEAVPVRDEAAEGRLVRQLQEELHVPPGRKMTYRGLEAVQIADTLRDFPGGIEGDALDNFFLAGDLMPDLHVGDGTFAASFRTRDGKRADPAAVLRAWSDGAEYVPLLGGGLAPLPADWLSRFGHRVADLLAARNDAGEVPTHSLPDLARLAQELDQPVPASYEKLRPLVEGFEGFGNEPVLPADLRAELRHYQRQGVAWLEFLRDAGLGALLADDMGLGKTLQTICAIKGRTLVVAPTSVLHNWAAELRRFRPGLKFAVFHGAQRKLDRDVDVVITTYAILRLDAELLAGQRWETVVLDEAQTIKNPDSQVARAAYGLRADFRVCLSGTPVENRLEELWSQLHFLNRGLLGGRKDFQERYVKPLTEGVPGAAERLRSRIRPFVLRRLKREVAPELPPRTDVVLHCTLNDMERSVYDAVRAASVAEVVKKLQAGGNVLQALEALLRLRQAACHPSLIPGQHASSSSKVELLLEQLDEAVADGHKSLVFSQWTGLLDLIEPHLRKAAIPFVRLDGSTVDRGAVVERFQAEDGPPVMIVSLKAGGTGLNLTAADHVFLLDPWWNPAVEDQAADRAHRIGQERPVVVHRLVAEETVEERILALQERKRGLAEAALGQGNQALELTRDDLLGLLA